MGKDDTWLIAAVGLVSSFDLKRSLGLVLVAGVEAFWFPVWLLEMLFCGV